MPQKTATSTPKKKSAPKADALAKAPQHATKSAARAVPAKAKKSPAPAPAVEAFDRAKAAPTDPPSVLRPEETAGYGVAGAVVATLIDTAFFIPSRFDVPHRDPDPELVDSIRERGNFQPIIARPLGLQAMVEHGLSKDLAPAEAAAKRYEIVLGECRWKGCTQTGRRVLTIVRDLSDEDAMAVQYEENAHRRDLTPLQEAAVFAHFVKKCGGDATAAAKKVHKTPAYLAKRLQLLELAPKARQALQSGAIQLGTAVEIACLPAESARAAALDLVLPHAGEEALSVREARDRITARFHLRMIQARFPLDDATLVPAAGACTKCPKRTTNQLALFGEGVKDDDRCSDRACWEAKTDAAWKQRKAAASSAGVTVLDGRAEGKDGEKARTTLYNPGGAGLLDLDTECDPVHQEQIDAAQARLDQAEEEKDEPAIEKARAELEELENQNVPTWRDVLGPAAPPLAAIGRTEHHGGRTDVHELVQEREAIKALAAKGHKLPGWMEHRLTEPEKPERPATVPSKTDEDKIARHAEHLKGTMITAAITTAAEAGHLDVQRMRALILATVAVIEPYSAERPGDLGDLETLIKRRGWSVDGEQTLADVVNREIARLSVQKLRGVLFEMLCAALEPAERASLGRAMGLDVGAIASQAMERARAELAAGEATKGRGKPKAGTCQICGCTEGKGCDMGHDERCTWIDKGETICSACAELLQLARELVEDGQPCEHCNGKIGCEHFAQELWDRADGPYLAGNFEDHKARIGAAIAYTLAEHREKKGEGKEKKRSAQAGSTKATRSDTTATE